MRHRAPKEKTKMGMETVWSVVWSVVALAAIVLVVFILNAYVGFTSFLRPSTTAATTLATA
jgi:heme/copper-type cytochrome/quinol oxidase subunit 2